MRRVFDALVLCIDCCCVPRGDLRVYICNSIHTGPQPAASITVMCSHIEAVVTASLLVSKSYVLLACNRSKRWSDRSTAATASGSSSLSVARKALDVSHLSLSSRLNVCELCSIPQQLAASSRSESQPLSDSLTLPALASSASESEYTVFPSEP